MPNWFDVEATRARDIAIESMRAETLRILRAYLAAYSMSVFPEPPPGEHAHTVDGCSARALRAVLPHIIRDVQTIEVS